MLAITVTMFVFSLLSSILQDLPYFFFICFPCLNKMFLLIYRLYFSSLLSIQSASPITVIFLRIRSKAGGIFWTSLSDIDILRCYIELTSWCSCQLYVMNPSAGVNTVFNGLCYFVISQCAIMQIVFDDVYAYLLIEEWAYLYYWTESC